MCALVFCCVGVGAETVFVDRGTSLSAICRSHFLHNVCHQLQEGRSHTAPVVQLVLHDVCFLFIPLCPLAIPQNTRVRRTLFFFSQALLSVRSGSQQDMLVAPHQRHSANAVEHQERGRQRATVVETDQLAAASAVMLFIRACLGLLAVTPVSICWCCCRCRCGCFAPLRTYLATGFHANLEGEKGVGWRRFW